MWKSSRSLSVNASRFSSVGLIVLRRHRGHVTYRLVLLVFHLYPHLRHVVGWAFGGIFIRFGSSCS
jgi:hypothetical protein